MLDYQLYTLSGSAFEEVVVTICQAILGTGVRPFAAGRDGGRDAAFNGTASLFPSPANPLAGKMVIQAKSDSNPVGKISDSGFLRTVEKEHKKIQKLVKSNDLDHYLLFTSNRIPAGAELKLEKSISKETDAQSVHILGREYISKFLYANPSAAKQHNLAQIHEPLRFYSDDLKLLIERLHATIGKATKNVASKFDLTSRKLKEKNKLNSLSPDYFEFIKEHSEPYFPQISEYLGKPINRAQKEMYHATVDELRSKILVVSSKYATFDEIFVELYNELLADGTIAKHRRLIHPILHFMYCSCDIGRK